MELSPRKKQILAAIVERYIADGEPVGSKVLCDSMSVSSATVRNEMAELAAMGLLDQPHTSAGRIPSQKGYRYYVDNIMARAELGSLDRFRIENRFDTSIGDPVSILEQAGNVLAELTGCAVIMSTPYDEHAVIRRVEIVPIGKRTAMVVMILSTGVIKSTVCRCTEKLDMSHVELFYKIAAAYFTGHRTDELTDSKIQTVASSLGDKLIVMLPLIAALKTLLDESAKRGVLTAGQSNLMNYYDSDSDASDILEFLKYDKAVSRVLSSSGNTVDIIIGRENRYRELENAGVILCGYYVGDKKVGTVGLVGPVRMDYARLASVLKFTSELISGVLKQTTEE